MLGDDIKSAYTRTKWSLVLRGVYGLVLGAFILARPLQSVAALAIVIAFWALLDGIVAIMKAFAIRDVAPHWWVLLVSGLISFAFGIAALYYYPGLSLTFAVLWTSLWLLTGGLMGVYVGVQERRFGLPWGWTTTLGVVAIVASVAAYMYPAITLGSLLGFIASYGIISGVVLLMGAWKLQSAQSGVASAMRAAV